MDIAHEYRLIDFSCVPKEYIRVLGIEIYQPEATGPLFIAWIKHDTPWIRRRCCSGVFKCVSFSVTKYSSACVVSVPHFTRSTFTNGAIRALSFFFFSCPLSLSLSLSLSFSFFPFLRQESRTVSSASSPSAASCVPKHLPRNYSMI